LYQYSSEKIETGVPEVDVFEDLKSFDITINPNIQEASGGFGDNQTFHDKAVGNVFDDNNPFGEV
jgi:hypothetical protein